VAALALAATAPALLLLAAVLAGLTCAMRPVEVAWEPQLLPDERDLFAAAGLRTGTRDALAVAGPAAAGVLVAVGGTESAFLAAATTYLVGAGLLRAIRSPGPPAAAPAVGHADQPVAARRAARIIWSSPQLRPVVLAFLTVVLVTALQPPVLFVYVQQVLLTGPAFYGLLMAAMAAGSVMASAVLVRWGGVPGRGRLLLLALVLPCDGLALIVLGTSGSLVVVSVCAFAMGGLNAVFGSMVRYTVQVATDETNRGRVFGLLFAVQGPAEIVSLLAVPLAAGGGGHGVGPGTLLAASGGLEIVLAAVVYLLAVRRRR
jgi:Na+/melibiose symporter-like transporter